MKKAEKLKLNPQILEIITKRKEDSIIPKYYTSYKIKCMNCGNEVVKKKRDARFCKRTCAVIFNKKIRNNILGVSPKN
jgi:hypothetical protein